MVWMDNVRIFNPQILETTFDVELFVSKSIRECGRWCNWFDFWKKLDINHIYYVPTVDLWFWNVMQFHIDRSFFFQRLGWEFLLERIEMYAKFGCQLIFILMNDALKMAKEMEKVYFRCKSKDKRGKKERRMEKK